MLVILKKGKSAEATSEIVLRIFLVIFDLQVRQIVPLGPFNITYSFFNTSMIKKTFKFDYLLTNCIHILKQKNIARQ